MYSDKTLYALIIENNKNQTFSRYIILDACTSLSNLDSILIKNFNNIKKVKSIHSIDPVTLIL